MPKLIYHDSDGMDKVLLLGSEPILVGRATECQIQTQDAMVSRRHARIFWDGNYWIEDLGSSNGVYVGNDRVQKAPFRPGDTVTCGSLVLRLMPDTSPRLTGGMAATSLPPPPAPPPPMAAAPPPAAPPPPSPRAEVQIGPNAVLRGAVAAPHATTGALGNIADELRLERQRREQAEARAAEFEEAAQRAALLQRKLDQAQADLRRLRGGKSEERTDETGGATEVQALRARVSDLEAQLAAAISAAGVPVAAAPPRPSVDPAAADAAVALGDALAELRASLRAANDEAPLLTDPRESVDVITEALRAAAEQLEAARSQLRALSQRLGVR